MAASQIVHMSLGDWKPASADPAWLADLEAGKVLYFPRLPFQLQADEAPLLRPGMLSEKARNVSLGEDGALKGAAGSEAENQLLAAMIARYRQQALGLVEAMFPAYRGRLCVAPTSFRPRQVETRQQSVRADDKRLHVDAFPTRPNRGERILRVFANVNPAGVPRQWRVGADFETIARAFLPRAKPYSGWQARALNALGLTKSLRSEYDHLMLQLHDLMKRDDDYQRNGTQEAIDFPPGSVWVCYSDQVVHAAMSGQFMMEQTLHLPPGGEADPQSSPLAILGRILGRPLAGV